MHADLSKKINSVHLNPDPLVEKYIPNLITKLFQVTKEYAQVIHNQTSSPTLNKVLKNWEQDTGATHCCARSLPIPSSLSSLHTSLLLPCAGLKCRVCSSLTSHDKFKHLIKLGSGPTLTGMVTRTLKAKYEASDDSISLTHIIYCHVKHLKEIYYQFEDEATQPEAAPKSAAAPEPAAATQAATAAPIAIAVPAPSAGPTAAIAEVSGCANFVLA